MSFGPIMGYWIGIDVFSLISSCDIVLADLRERQKAVNSYPPSIHLTSEQTPQLATGTHHPSLLLKPDPSGKDSCTGQRAKQLSKTHYQRRGWEEALHFALVFSLTAFLNNSSPNYISISTVFRNP